MNLSHKKGKGGKITTEDILFLVRKVEIYTPLLAPPCRLIIAMLLQNPRMFYRAKELIRVMTNNALLYSALVFFPNFFFPESKRDRKCSQNPGPCKGKRQCCALTYRRQFRIQLAIAMTRGSFDLRIPWSRRADAPTQQS